MPSKSVKQRNYIFALRNQYKDIEHTPDNKKWIWETAFNTIEKKKKGCSIDKTNIFFTYYMDKVFSK